MRIWILILFSCIASLSFSQNTKDKEKENYIVRSHKIITGTDTITQHELLSFSVASSYSEEYKKYTWYRAMVAKFYPYTQLIKEMIVMYDSSFSGIDSKKERRKYRDAEFEKMKEQFGYFISTLQHTEGRIFCKMIHRETRLTSYEITRKYLGGPKAFLWQGISVLGGADLKYKYNPGDEDGVVLEKIFTEINEGKFFVLKKPYFIPKKKNEKAEGKNVTVVRK